MAAGDETSQILGQLRSYLARLADEHTRTMAAAWARAWDDVAPELASALAELQADATDGKLTRAKIIRARRLQNALTLVEGQLAALFDESAAKIIDQLSGVIDHAGRVTDRLISSQLPHGEQVDGWSRVDVDQVEAIVARTTEQITKRSFPLSDESTATMRRELVRGMLVGSNPRQVAARMLQRTEGIFNGGLSRALTIARTEQLDAQRAAAQLGEKQNTDVLQGWVWSASLSARTCPACWGMNGTEHSLEESGPNGHQNCRCVRLPKTKTWKELGFNIEEPRSLLPDKEAVFGRLSTSEQIDILGPSRFAAWDAGKFPMSKWATTRDNVGWRKSVVPASAPVKFRGTRRSTVDDTTKPYRFGRNAKRLGSTPKSVLSAIQGVHDVPLLKDPLTVLAFTPSNKGGQGRFSVKDMTLRINPSAIAKGLTTAHEFGHYLDFQDFGNAQTLASLSSVSNEWLALRYATDQTPEVKTLRAFLADKSNTKDLRDHVEYLLGREELFARAYAQWIARKTDRRGLKSDLEKMRKLPGPDGSRQWADGNFDDISDALDALLGSRLRP